MIIPVCLFGPASTSDSPLEQSRHWRNTAKQARTALGLMSREEIKGRLLRVAEDCDQLATEAERQCEAVELG